MYQYGYRTAVRGGSYGNGYGAVPDWDVHAVDLAVLNLLLFYMCHTVFEQKYPDFIEFFGLSKNAIKDTTRWPMSVLFVGVTLFP